MPSPLRPAAWARFGKRTDAGVDGPRDGEPPVRDEGWRGRRFLPASKLFHSQPREVDRLSQDAHSFLIGVKPHRILGLDEVHIELGGSLVTSSAVESWSVAVCDRSLRDRIHQVEQRVDRDVPHLERAVLNRVHPTPQFLLGHLVTGLAGLGDVEERAPHVVVADLERTTAFIRHVTVGAGHSGTSVDPLAVHLEFGMLRLEYLRAACFVSLVMMPVRFVVSEDAVHSEAPRPWIGQPLLRTLEVVLNMALAADEGSHFLS